MNPSFLYWDTKINKITQLIKYIHTFRAILLALIGSFILVTSIVKSSQFTGWRWVIFILATYIVFFVGRNIHLYAIAAAKNLNANMNTLISIGTLTAWTWSVVALLRDTTLYFETAAIVTLVVLFGQWLEGQTTKSTHNAISNLKQMVPKKVLLESGKEIEITELQPKMRFLAREGELIASDGTVIDGNAAVDTSMITGEPLNHHIKPGDTVIGSTIVTKGSLLIEATRTGEDTFHRHIIGLIDKILSSRAPVQKLVDKVSGIYTYSVIFIALLTAAIWWLAVEGSGVNAFEHSIAILIIACPCALGLATPIAILAATSRGAEQGIILRNTGALETIKNIDTIALDKTGTLTSGKIHIQKIILSENAKNIDGLTETKLLNLAVALESHSIHPIGIAIVSSSIVSSAKNNKHDNLPLDFFPSTIDGMGIEALTKENKKVAIGKAELFKNVPEELLQAQLTAQARGEIAVFCGNTQQAQGLIILSDDIREEAKSVISELIKLKMRPVMITGDSEMPAMQLGKELGIEEIHHNVLPDQKVAIIEKLQNENGKNKNDKNTVLMVGDGTNDTAALIAADLSIAIGSSTEVAIESSDIALLGTDLKAIPTAIKLAQKTRNTIIGNLFWAFLYNSVAIPLAAFGLLSPIIASIAMSLSSLFVVLNSTRLRYLKY